MVSFLLHKLKYRWPQVEWGLRMKSFSHIVLLISTSRIQLVLHPHCFPPRLQSLRLAINWWQSRSPRSSSGPGSLRPVFWSTHQHFPRWPSRAGWHCLGWKSPFLSQLGMGIVKRSSCVRVFDANLSNALWSSARHGARIALASSLALLLLRFVDFGGCRARVFCMHRLSCGLHRILLLFGCSGVISSCLSIAEFSSTSLSSVQIPWPCISECSGLSTPLGG